MNCKHCNCEIVYDGVYWVHRVLMGGQLTCGDPSIEQLYVWDTVERNREYSDGKLRYEGHFKESGVHHGRCRAWYENGQLKFENHFKDGKQHGRKTHWNPNGEMIALLYHKKGQRQGLCRSWDDEGRMDFEELYKDNKVVDFPHGVLFVEGTIHIDANLAYNQTKQ